MVYLIQGFFFQKQSWLDLNASSEAIVRSGLIRSMYAGVIGTEKPGATEGTLFGTMFDLYGDSELTDVILTETEFRFTKVYDRRGDPIYYVFNKQPDGTWFGTWRGSLVGNGTSRCVLTNIEESFLQIAPEPEQISL